MKRVPAPIDGGILGTDTGFEGIVEYTYRDQK